MTIIIALPTAPSRTMDAETFVTTSDTFVAALSPMTEQINAVNAEVNANAVAAASSAVEAAASADYANNSKNAVLATANATAWVSGRAYPLYSNVISPINFQTYRKRTALSATVVDPSADPANWVVLQIDKAWFVISADFTATSGDPLLVDTRTAPVVVTLPSTFLVQNQTTVYFKDLYGSFGTNPLTVNYSGSNPIEGILENMTVPNNNISFALLYVGGTRGWALV